MIELSYFAACAVVFVFFCIRILHMNSRAEWPQLTYRNLAEFVDFDFTRNSASDADTPVVTHSDSCTSVGANESGFMAELLKHAPIFSKPYVPPLLWGRSGHLQTIIHSTFGRHKVPREKGDSRHEVILSDGTTVTFDLFQPLSSNSRARKEEVTLLLCPGIGNSSESVGIKTFAHHANEKGMRVAVLNHLGVIPSIPLTTPRMFTYGSTEEYGAMVSEIKKMYPDSLLVAIGFSMGGNIVCKYIGESAEQRQQFVGMVSCCQGYDIVRLFDLMETGKLITKGYMRAITMHMEKVLYNFRHVLLNESVLQKYGLNSEYDVLNCGDILKMDDLLLAGLAGYSDCREYYELSSSSKYIPQIDIPALFLNALDDPLVPEEVLDTPRNHAKNNPTSLFVTTKHGGHLGYFESQNNSVFSRGTFTWLDRAIIQFTEALLIVTARKSQLDLT